MGLNAEKSDIPEQGRISGGVKGIMLADDDLVVSANQVVAGQNIVLVSDAAYAKQINVSEVDVLAEKALGSTRKQGYQQRKISHFFILLSV